MSNGERARLTALVRGRVQGVGYRAFAIDRARALGVGGHVRNLSDHCTVEIVAEGERATLDAFVTDLWRGPHAARVADVEVHWSPATGEAETFEPRF